MRINARDLEPGEVVQVRFAEVIDSESPEVAFDAPVSGEIEVVRTARTLQLTARVQTELALVCSRCLASIRYRLAAAPREEFWLDGPPPAPAGERELGEEDFTFPLGPEQVLDVTDVLRQHLLLAVPMAPLCRPDCRGLCPQCGTNWNDARCDCVPEAGDPRLAPLAELRHRLPED